MSTNDRVRILGTEILFDGWAVLKRVSMAYRRRDGAEDRMDRLIADHGDGAAVLAYDPDRGTVLLVRQFRLAAYMNGHPEAMLEACAGRLDGDDPATCVLREAVEEMGYRLAAVEPAFTAFVSPSFDTEKIIGFIARYSPSDKVEAGGGLADEHEDIEVVEMAFSEAMTAISAGVIVDAKTIMLLQHLKILGLMGG